MTLSLALRILLSLLLVLLCNEPSDRCVRPLRSVPSALLLLLLLFVVLPLPLGEPRRGKRLSCFITSGDAMRTSGDPSAVRTINFCAAAASSDLVIFFRLGETGDLDASLGMVFSSSYESRSQTSKKVVGCQFWVCCFRTEQTTVKSILPSQHNLYGSSQLLSKRDV